MKWQIAPESRDEYRKKQAKRGAGSAPSSPASSKEVNPNFRGPNGQNLGYDTTMVSSFSAKDGAPAPPGRITFQPQANYPQPVNAASAFAAPLQSQEAITPQRRRADTGNTIPESSAFDDSPLPHRQAGHVNGPQTYTLPPALPISQQSPHERNRNPTLSSSYIDTPYHHSQHSIITPAPIRQNPRLAPPSTLVAPSKFMPESSPAGPGLFWKGLMGVTPGHPIPDISPVKIEDTGRPNPNGIDRHVMSSSPPPMDAIGSPSKSGPGRSSQLVSSSADKREYAGDDVEMRSRSASAAAAGSNGFNAAPVQFGTNANAKAQLHSTKSANAGPSMNGRRDDDDDEEEGFDLAKGFAPIAGIRRTGSVNAR